MQMVVSGICVVIGAVWDRIEDDFFPMEIAGEIWGWENELRGMFGVIDSLKSGRVMRIASLSNGANLRNKTSLRVFTLKNEALGFKA